MPERKASWISTNSDSDRRLVAAILPGPKHCDISQFQDAMFASKKIMYWTVIKPMKLMTINPLLLIVLGVTCLPFYGLELVCGFI